MYFLSTSYTGTQAVDRRSTYKTERIITTKRVVEDMKLGIYTCTTFYKVETRLADGIIKDYIMLFVIGPLYCDTFSRYFYILYIHAVAVNMNNTVI